MEDTSFNIIVKTSRASYIVQAQPFWTVRELIDSFDRILGLPSSTYTFGELNLKDNLPTILEDIGLTEESIVVVNNPSDISVIVRTLTGKNITMNMNPLSTINDFKQKYQDHEGIPPDMVVPIFNGKSLNDDTTIGEHDIVDGSKIIVLLKLRGD